MNKYIFATSIKQDGNMSATFGLKQALYNRARFINFQGLNPAGLVILKQVHGNNVVKIDSSKCGLANTNTQVAKADAIVTNDPDVVLAVFTADCLPIFIYDELSGCFGIAHAGRKGTVANIAAKTVKALVSNFNSQTENIKIMFGPCIHKCHYEQQQAKDAEKIKEYEDLFPTAVEQRDGKYYFDLIASNIQQLTQIGIKKNKINSRISQCTECNTDKYWSYHRPQKIEGVMISVIGVKRGDTK